MGVMTIAAVLLLAVFVKGFSIVSHAESAAKVTAASANIRKEPNSTSETIGSTERDKVISIKSQVQGSDGYTWYEVYVNADTLGYIRSDLVQITDGTTPPTGSAPATSTPPPSTPTQAPTAQIPDEPLVDVTAVNPASAAVTGGESVRIRQNASTTSRIITTVKNGMALTITGMATGTDGKQWYQVTLLSNGAETTGFIRSDFTTVKAEELTPLTADPPAEEPPAEEPPADNPEAPVEPAEEKAYETILQDGQWMLVDVEGKYSNNPGEAFSIDTVMEGVKKNAAMYEESEKTVKMQKIIIIILVIILVIAAAAITLLIFKVKDITDAQYFNEVENETLQRRGARTQGGGQKAIQTAGNERQGGRGAGARQGASQGQQRPQGGRPAGASQGQRPQGGRPAGASQGQRPQGSRPAGEGQGQRPQGGRPAGEGQRPQGGRPAGEGQRPQGGRPAGAQGQRPQGARPAEQPPQGNQRPASQGQRPQGNRPASQGQQNPGWQSKNFMADEDEFEFEFLNYDGDDSK